MTRTLTDDEVTDLAAAHEQARRSVTPIDPVSRSCPGMTIDDAYAIQRAWMDLRLREGRTITGHKVGLTSRAMQQAMRIDEPDFGALLDDMFHESGAELACADYLDPKIEVELAFVLHAPLDRADVSRDDVLAATESIVPALELIDARSHRVHPDDGRPRTVLDTISDNAADAGVVTGGRPIDPAAVAAGAVDLRWVGAICRRDGVVEETGLAAGVLGDPVLGVVWLAARLHGYGIALEAGQTILAGSFTRPIDCRPGDRFDVDFGPHGELAVSFT